MGSKLLPNRLGSVFAPRQGRSKALIMALADTYTVAISRLPDIFAKIRDGQAPDHFTQQLLKDWGFNSSNDRAFLPILKALGFLSPDGKPTSVYHEYRDHSRSKKVLGRALRQAYGDLFLIKEHPTSADRTAIEGKFKSFHNVSDNVARLMTKTFLSLVTLADLTGEPITGGETQKETRKGRPLDQEEKNDENADEIANQRKTKIHTPGLHYNIQIHLPATKDVEVYNAIFKSLKEHLFET
jgi:hypothetical protein